MHCLDSFLGRNSKYITMASSPGWLIRFTGRISKPWGLQTLLSRCSAVIHPLRKLYCVPRANWEMRELLTSARSFLKSCVNRKGHNTSEYVCFFWDDLTASTSEISCLWNAKPHLRGYGCGDQWCEELSTWSFKNDQIWQCNHNQHTSKWMFPKIGVPQNGWWK